jgi:ribonucleoside-diphosphate reductase alpha chain
VDAVDSGRLRLLKKKHETEIEAESVDKDTFQDKVVPHIQTDLLVEEISNLKIEHTTGGGIRVEKVVRRLDKDRYSALAYLLWYIAAPKITCQTTGYPLY